MLGSQAVKLEAPTVPFKEAERYAQSAPEWLRQACRGHGKGLTQRYLDDVLEMRRAHISDVSSGSSDHPRPDFERRPYSIVSENEETSISIVQAEGDKFTLDASPFRQIERQDKKEDIRFSTPTKSKSTKKKTYTQKDKGRVQKRKNNKPLKEKVEKTQPDVHTTDNDEPFLG